MVVWCFGVYVMFHVHHLLTYSLTHSLTHSLTIPTFIIFDIIISNIQNIASLGSESPPGGTTPLCTGMAICGLCIACIIGGETRGERSREGKWRAKKKQWVYLIIIIQIFYIYFNLHTLTPLPPPSLPSSSSLASESSPCYLNRMDATEIAVGWGKTTAELIRAMANRITPWLMTGFGSWGLKGLEIMNCLAPPAQEYKFPRDLFLH